MRHPGKHALLLAFTVALSGCFKVEMPSNSNFHQLDYNLIDVKTSIDPKTGNIVRVTTWRYADGVTVTITDMILPGGDIERRRQEHLPTPQARFVD